MTTTATTLRDDVLDELATEIELDVEHDDGAVVVLPRHLDDLNHIAAKLQRQTGLVVCVRQVLRTSANVPKPDQESPAKGRAA